MGFSGNLVFDKTKPDGTMRKLLDVTRLETLGYKAAVIENWFVINLRRFLTERNRTANVRLLFRWVHYLFKIKKSRVFEF